jgi:hypothetical protein
MQLLKVLLQVATITATASASAIPHLSATESSASCPPCDLSCPRVTGNSIGVPKFCAIVNGKPLCVPAPSCGGSGGGIGGGTFCPDGFRCVPDDIIGAGSKMCVPLWSHTS